MAMATRAIGAAESDGATLSLAAGDSVTIVTAVASSIDLQGADPTDAVSKAVRSATPSSIQALEAAHVAWWASYWAQSAVSLPASPAMEVQWYRALTLAGVPVTFG